MSEFNFKSQSATSIEQSKRLLALGLKKETADCYYWQECDQYGDPNGKWHLDILNDDTREYFEYLLNHFGICLHLKDALFIPAWSLGRLIEMIPQIIDLHDFVLFHTCAGYINNDYHIKAGFNGTLFDACISCIEWLIKEGHFNKEYLI